MEMETVRQDKGRKSEFESATPRNPVWFGTAPYQNNVTNAEKF